MTCLFHLSDLHFGPKFNEHLSDVVLQEIIQATPDLTIISGDFTMRGRIDEYERARAYVARVPKPVLTIPGNHDQPLSLDTAFERLTTPWARYTKYFVEQTAAGRVITDAEFEMPGIFVLGVNDNHPIVPGGVWSGQQRAWMEKEFSSAPDGACKILVMHHQLNWNGKWRPFGQWFPTVQLNWLKSLGVELVLNGHTHIPITIQTEQGIVIAQSGTTMSTRVRHGHGNTYNQILVMPDSLKIRVMEYDASADKFLPRQEQVFQRNTQMQESNG